MTQKTGFTERDLLGALVWLMRNTQTEAMWIGGHPYTYKQIKLAAEVSSRVVQSEEDRT